MNINMTSGAMICYRCAIGLSSIQMIVVRFCLKFIVLLCYAFFGSVLVYPCASLASSNLAPRHLLLAPEDSLSIHFRWVMNSMRKASPSCTSPLGSAKDEEDLVPSFAVAPLLPVALELLCNSSSSHNFLASSSRTFGTIVLLGSWFGPLVIFVLVAAIVQEGAS